MAATIVVSVSYGAGPTVSDSVSGVDLISADNATNSLANRQANPITVGTNSYEKWIRLKVTATPANYVQSFKVWFAASVDASTTLFMTGAYQTYQQGTTATSTIADVDATTYTSGNKAVWDDNQYTAGQLNVYTEHLVLQLEVGSDAGPGNWTQQTVNYSYDEA
jgi:hypothetical protein